MPARVIASSEIGPSTARIFSEVQSSVANHGKNYVTLHKLHLQAHQCVEPAKDGYNLTGERAFENAFIEMLLKVFPLKKGNTAGDRLIKFAGGYTRHCNQKAEENPEENGLIEGGTTTAERFIKRLLKFLTKGFNAKDKLVRYRVVQTVSEMVSHLGAIDEDIYNGLRDGLIARANDKETSVRVQSIIALSKLIDSDEDDGLDAEEDSDRPSAYKTVRHALRHDPSPEVRRSALTHIPLRPMDLDFILTRTRDTETSIRKALYSQVLSSHVYQPNESDETVLGITHPRAFSIAQREVIVRNGLGDREGAVKAAAASLVSKWLDAMEDEANVKNEVKDEDSDSLAASKSKSATDSKAPIMQLLSMFYLDQGIASTDLLKVLFEKCPGFIDTIQFDNQYWRNMTMEQAFLARVFVEYCLAQKDEKARERAQDMMDANLPVVTAMAFHIDEAFKAWCADKAGANIQEIDDAKIDELYEQEFVLAEMLKIAANLDYGDEMGRRKMFTQTREILGAERIPDIIIYPCLDIMKKLSTDERDLIRVVVEIVQDLRDPHGDEIDQSKDTDPDMSIDDDDAPKPPPKPRSSLFHKPMEDLTPEEKRVTDEIDLRCLNMCIGMLERVMGSLEDNSSLDGILQELILPSVQKKEMEFRELGLIGLGLYSLIARTLALKTMSLFVGQVQAAPLELKMSILKIIFDMVMVHVDDFLKKDENADQIRRFLFQLLGQETEDDVQALICMGMAKLVLAGMLNDDQTLENLLMAYLNPTTVDNQSLRQCLSYFFDMYSLSSDKGQKQIVKIFKGMVAEVNSMRDELEEDEEMPPPAQILAMFVDWTDPIKAIEIRGEDKVDKEIQIDLATEALGAIIEQDELKKEDKKALCQMLNKLHLPENVDDDKIRTLHVLVTRLLLTPFIRDNVAKNALKKFESTIKQKYEKQLEDFDPEEYRAKEQYSGLHDKLDEMADEEPENALPKRKGRKRRSDSMKSDKSDSDASAGPRNRKGKAKPKRRRMSSEDDDDSTPRATPPAPRRTLPKRSAAAAAEKKVEVIETEEDDEDIPVPNEDNEDDDEFEYSADEDTGKQRQRRPAIKTEKGPLAYSHHEAASGANVEIEDDEEEDEVNDLLADD